MLSKDFIAGLVCGEGGFSKWQIIQHGRVYRVHRFTITLHEVDLPLLLELKESLNYGTVRRKSSPKDNPVYTEYMITRFADLVKFVEEISPFLVGNKKKQCDDWYKDLINYKKSKGKIK